jgi:hypothetical protein
MDETKIELPAWIPWATTACLAALVGCLVELLFIERSRTEMLKEENLLAKASLKGAQNQLEVERIVSRREIEEMRESPGPRAAMLSAPNAGARAPDAPWGIVTWDPSARHAVLRFSGLAPPAPGRNYQLWLEGSGPGYPIWCGAFNATSSDGFPVDLASPAASGYRFIVLECKIGGSWSLEEEKAGGSIVLASLPEPGKISN